MRATGIAERQAAEAPRPADAHGRGGPGARHAGRRAGRARPTSRSSRSRASTRYFDDYGAPRGQGVHQGIDIMADRGHAARRGRRRGDLEDEPRRDRPRRHLRLAPAAPTASSTTTRTWSRSRRDSTIGSRITVGQVRGRASATPATPAARRRTCTSRSGTRGPRSTRTRTSRRSIRPPAPPLAPGRDAAPGAPRPARRGAAGRRGGRGGAGRRGGRRGRRRPTRRPTSTSGSSGPATASSRRAAARASSPTRCRATPTASARSRRGSRRCASARRASTPSWPRCATACGSSPGAWRSSRRGWPTPRPSSPCARACSSGRLRDLYARGEPDPMLVLLESGSLSEAVAAADVLEVIVEPRPRPRRRRSRPTPPRCGARATRSPRCGPRSPSPRRGPRSPPSARAPPRPTWSASRRARQKRAAPAARRCWTACAATARRSRPRRGASRSAPPRWPTEIRKAQGLPPAPSGAVAVGAALGGRARVAGARRDHLRLRAALGPHARGHRHRGRQRHADRARRRPAR